MYGNNINSFSLFSEISTYVVIEEWVAYTYVYVCISSKYITLCINTSFHMKNDTYKQVFALVFYICKCYAM